MKNFTFYTLSTISVFDEESFDINQINSNKTQYIEIDGKQYKLEEVTISSESDAKLTEEVPVDSNIKKEIHVSNENQEMFIIGMIIFTYIILLGLHRPAS